MKRFRGSRVWLWLVAGASIGCDAREVPVFEVMPSAGGTAGASNAGTGGGGGSGDVNGAGLDSGGAGMAGSGGMVTGSAGALPAAGTAGSGGSAPQATMCESAGDCMPSWQCDKQGCDALMGVCKPPPPVFCPPDPSPVCGCDGITYWNDCVRRQVGTPLAAPGECSVTACACEVDADCEQEGASCAHLVQGADMCHGGGPGACWVLPTQCMPNQSDPPVWQECRPPDAPPAPCVDTCLAIRSGHPHKKRFDQCAP